MRLLHTKAHLTSEGLEQIKELKSSLYNKNKEESLTEDVAPSCLHVKAPLTMTSSKKSLINHSFLDSYKGKSIESIYVYNRDKSVLYYSTDNKEKFLQECNIHGFTFEKHLEKGTYYLRRYLFTNYLVPASNNKKMTVSEFALKLENERKSLKKKG